MAVIETGTAIVFVGLGALLWKVITPFNRFLGNMGFTLLGLGMFFYFVQQDQALFGFGGLFIAMIFAVKMIWDLVSPPKGLNSR